MKKYSYRYENHFVIETEYLTENQYYETPWDTEKLKKNVFLGLLFEESYYRTLAYLKKEKPEWLL